MVTSTTETGQQEEFLKVLLVDDDEDEMVLTRYLLSECTQKTFDLSWTSDYNRGLENLQREKFDAALIDYRLGQQVGLELIRELTERGCQTPLIMLTNQGDELVAVKAMKLGADDYLPKKNLTPTALQRAITNAVDKARLRLQVQQKQRELERLARNDELTGLMNRRALFDSFQIELSRTIRHHLDLAVLLIDLDHFKEVNDRYGHFAGDEVLMTVGRLLQEGIRNTDFAGRFGGEEFVAVLPQTDDAGALTIAERLRSKLEQHVFFTRGERFQVTASLGISVYQLGDTHCEAILDRADQALYDAKRAGRNQCCSFEGSREI